MKPIPKWRTSPEYIKKQLDAAKRSTERGVLRSQMTPRPGAPVSLPKINGPTMEEIEAKYGDIR